MTVWDWAEAWNRPKLHCETGLSWIELASTWNSVVRLARVDLRQVAMSHCLYCGLWWPSLFAGWQHNSLALIIHAYIAWLSCSICLGRISNPGWSFILWAGAASAVFLLYSCWSVMRVSGRREKQLYFQETGLSETLGHIFLNNAGMDPGGVHPARPLLFSEGRRF